MASPNPDMTDSTIFGNNRSKSPTSRLLLIKYLRVGCLALSLMSLVFAATSYSTNRWSVSASDLAVDKYNLPLTFADRHTKDAECRTKICRILDERKDALLVGRIYRGLTSVCEMIQRRTGETLLLTCARTDDNFIDVNVIRRLQLSAVIISTFGILTSAWLLAIGLHQPISPGTKKVICGSNIRKFPVIKVGECTLVLQIISIILYLLASLLLAMGSVMFVSNKQTEEVVSYSFFFSTVAFSCHLVASLAVSTDFFVCAALSNHVQRHQNNNDSYSPGGGDTSSNSSSTSTGIGMMETGGGPHSNFSTVSALGINFRPITLSSKPPPPVANLLAATQNGASSSQVSANPAVSPNNNNTNNNFEPPPFMTCMRYHD